MALFKCKMCGASLDVKDGETIIECEYCGTQQTLPKTTDENIQALFNRANLLRQKNEFDKAEALYEKILVADSTEAEAYWGVILCKFGIEYVEDPKTYKRIPTCHRTSYDSIVADEYYKKALENADVVQRGVYEAEAKVIDGIQKGILAISAQEEPYDVFICYKEADENGKRTQDSVIANDIYYQLTQEGFKVFYVAITLEDKLGSAYEPIIFAALNSSKVMLSIGTRAEYFNAVWVKNEWSRFLKMMKNDRSKMLIPCYKGMDAYELPEEFAHLQAQDMGKIGFINDIVRGIKKVIVKDEPKQATVVKETVVSGANTNIAPLLKRAFMFLEDGEWNEAVEYCEKVLDIEPECAEAYLGRLMAELHVKSKEKLKYCDKPFDDKPLYAKVIRFASEDVVSELKQYNNTIRERNEEARKSKIYNTAVSLASQQTPEKQIEAADEFEKIPEYRDAKERAEECFAKSKELAEIKRKDAIYNDALSMMNKNKISSHESAIKKFKSIIDWKDSESKIQECDKKISKIKEQQEKAKAKKRVIIISAISAVVFTLALIFAIIPFVNFANRNYATYINLYGIEHFEIPEGTTKIKENAFEKCRSLKSVTIPDSVTSIGSGAFSNCDSLTSIVIPNSVTSISEHAFSCCFDLTSVIIPDSVTSIGSSAFSYCYDLTSVVIPNSVTSIGESAFSRCYDLTSIKYRGTKEQWTNIAKGYNWDYYTGSYTITYNYTDGE